MASTSAFCRAAFAPFVAGSMSRKTPPSRAIMRVTSSLEQAGVPDHGQRLGPRVTLKKSDTQGRDSCADGPLVSMRPGGYVGGEGRGHWHGSMEDRHADDDTR